MAYCHFELCRDCELGVVVGWYTEAVGGGGGVSNNFFYNKTQQHHFWNYIIMTQCKLYTLAAAAAVAVNKEVADGADVVFTDTDNISWYIMVIKGIVLFSVPRDGNQGLENAILRTFSIFDAIIRP